MKRYIKSSIELDMKLPALDKALAQIRNDENLKNCDFQYRVEDDGVDGSILVYLADYNEYVGSNEFYEYDFIQHIFNKFEKAVQKDTGDKNFYFEPYSNVDFCGRAWVN